MDKEAVPPGSDAHAAGEPESTPTESPARERPVAYLHPTAGQRRPVPPPALQDQGLAYHDSELILGLVGAVGTELKLIANMIEERLQAYRYNADVIKVSSHVIDALLPETDAEQTEFERISSYMNRGNECRKRAGEHGVLALGVAQYIFSKRTIDGVHGPAPDKRKAYIVNSLKHPAEVQRLREIYSTGFFAIGVFADESRRQEHLTDERRIEATQALDLIKRDADENDDWGQHTGDTFHLCDFFIHFDGDSDKVKHDLWRILDLLFGSPFITPTFDEFAMNMAFSSALRSADLSRQVGAIIARDGDVVSSGANDVPKYGGGLYFPEFNEAAKAVKDHPRGRDYMRGGDSNVLERSKIIADILSELPESNRETVREVLGNSQLKDLTEYGRIVHAEMEAILACGRNGISTRGTTLYCTTFPCHNCAKHIVDAGITRVVFVEPYPKSKALEFHDDSISYRGTKNGERRVSFEPFVGVGARSFFDLFSLRWGAGYPVTRKDSEGRRVEWNSERDGRLRTQMIPLSYLEKESLAVSLLEPCRDNIGGRSNGNEQ